MGDHLESTRPKFLPPLARFSPVYQTKLHEWTNSPLAGGWSEDSCNRLSANPRQPASLSSQPQSCVVCTMQQRFMTGFMTAAPFQDHHIVTLFLLSRPLCLKGYGRILSCSLQEWKSHASMHICIHTNLTTHPHSRILSVHSCDLHARFGCSHGIALHLLSGSACSPNAVTFLLLTYALLTYTYVWSLSWMYYLSCLEQQHSRMWVAPQAPFHRLDACRGIVLHLGPASASPNIPGLSQLCS